MRTYVYSKKFKIFAIFKTLAVGFREKKNNIVVINLFMYPHSKGVLC